LKAEEVQNFSGVSQFKSVSPENHESSNSSFLKSTSTPNGPTSPNNPKRKETN